MFTESAMTTMIRFSAYTIVIFCCTASLPLLVEQGDISAFKENGPIEWLQVVLLVSAGALFLVGSFLVSAFRQLFLIFASLVAFMVFRELDSLLNQTIPWIGWKIGFLLILYAAGLAYASRNALKRQIAQILHLRAFATLWAGFVIAIPISQLIGHGNFLQELMGEEYIRDYKRVIEESGELLGYILLVGGSLESIVQLKAQQIGVWQLAEQKKAVQKPD